MASRRQKALSSYLDGNPFVGDEEIALACEGGSSELQAMIRRLGRSDVGDRRDDRLARTIALAPLAAIPILAMADSTRRSAPASSQPSYASSKRGKGSFSDEIDRQIAARRDEPVKPQKYDGWWRMNGKAAPGKTIELVLDPKKPIVDPKLFVDTEGEPENMQIVGITLGGRPFLVNKKADELRGIELKGVTISSSNPLKITILNKKVSGSSTTFFAYFVYETKKQPA